MATRKSSRSRKRRRAGAAPRTGASPRAGAAPRTGAAPRAVPSTRREVHAERELRAERERRPSRRAAGREGERPEGMFGGLPISELAILVGLIAAVIGFLNHGGPALIVGLIVCALGVVEVTAREHFSGYRSHAVLLAAIPAIAVEVALVVMFGEPRTRALLLVAVVPVFGVLFWLLRRRFASARQARIARPPAPPLA